MNQGFGNDEGGGRRLYALECNRLKLGEYRESRLSVERERFSIASNFIRRRTFARSQKRMTSARAAYATHLPFLI